MMETDQTNNWDERDDYVERMVRHKVGASALRKIHALVVDMERVDQGSRKVAIFLVAIFAVLVVGFLGYLALR